ncbi:MAG: transcriptional regulator [Planctomycetota bacterium]|nr:MAG: transcriptional regulator [Planctomycetota bacterium]
MPEISRFLGIVIRMYYRDHAPPHFHAEYGDNEITVELESGIVEGRFPRRALSAVFDWYELHREALQENWNLARAEQPLNPIEPLE